MYQRCMIQEQTLRELDILTFVINEKHSKRSLETLFHSKGPFWLILFGTLHIIS